MANREMNVMDDDELDEVMNEFIIESRDNLDQLDQALVDLETNHDAEVVARIFRTIHTIKGTSGFLGLGTLESLTHVGETLLAKVRDGSLPVTTAITTALLSLVDAVREILQSIGMNGGEGDLAYPDLIAELTQLSTAAAPAPDTAVHGAGMLGGQLLREGKITEAQLAAALRRQDQGDQRRLGEILVEQGAITPAEVRDALKTHFEDQPNANETIRVDVGLLDDLMNLVGELVLARNQILEFVQPGAALAFTATSQRLNLITTELQAGVMKTRMQPIENIWNRFPRVIRDLTMSCGKKARLEMEGKHTELDKTLLEAIKDPLTHLVRNAVDHGLESPAGRLANGKPAEGLVRLRAFHEGGHVIVEISDDGAGINVDKLRNKAVEKGVLGADEAAALSDRDMIDVIFQPGFSTAETVSNISGRGVGMDVVRSNIEGIGGSVEVHTVLGVGTTFRVKIPLTLAIIPALVVAVGEGRYAIPQISLLELLRLDVSQTDDGRTVLPNVEWIQGAPVHRLRGRLLPLVFLRDVFEGRVLDGSVADEGVTNRVPSGGESMYIVVVQADDHQFGLVVDGISDTSEIVVKPLGRLLSHVEAFAGATIMGDGRVALILDVMGIAKHVGITSGVRQASRLTVEATDPTFLDIAASRCEPLLLCNIGTRRFCLPLEAVARLEEFEADAIELTGRRRAVQYKGEIIHLIDLAEMLSVPAERADGRPLRVIVCTDDGVSAGLVVDEIFDIVEEEVVASEHSSDFGIIGTAVIHGLITDVIDVHQILRGAAPALSAVASVEEFAA